jgi:hypothetical protein
MQFSLFKILKQVSHQTLIVNENASIIISGNLYRFLMILLMHFMMLVCGVRHGAYKHIFWCILLKT